MTDLNRITLVGRIGKDAEAHEFSNGDLRATFTLATSERWKDDAGAAKERTQWHNVSITNQGLAKVALDYVKKGGHVLVEGAMEYRNWTDNDGAKRTAAEVVMRPYGDGRIVLLDPPKKGRDPQP